MDHWRRGHKQICKKIHRGGNAEQYYADKKYKEAVAKSVETWGPRSLYVPRFSVTFYLYEDPTKSFAEFILPIALSYVASTWNLLHVGQKQDADYASYSAQINSHGAFETYVDRPPRLTG